MIVQLSALCNFLHIFYRHKKSPHVWRLFKSTMINTKCRVINKPAPLQIYDLFRRFVRPNTIALMIRFSTSTILSSFSVSVSAVTVPAAVKIARAISDQYIFASSNIDQMYGKASKRHQAINGRMPTDHHAATYRLFFVVLGICRRVRFAVEAATYLHTE